MGKCVSCLHPKEKKNVLKEETPSNTEGTGETPPNTQRTGETPPSTSGTAEQTPPLVKKTPEETLPSTSGTAEQTPSLVKGRPEETPPSTLGTAEQTPPLETERPEETPPSTSGTAEQTPSSTSGTAEQTPPLVKKTPEETPPSTSGTAEQTPSILKEKPEETPPSTSGTAEQTPSLLKEKPEETPPSTSGTAEKTPPLETEIPEETPPSTSGTAEQTPSSTSGTAEQTPPSTSGTAEQTPSVVKEIPEETQTPPSTSGTAEQTPPLVDKIPEETPTPPSTSRIADQTPPVVKERPEETQTPPLTAERSEKTPSVKERAEETLPPPSEKAEQTPSSLKERPEETPSSTLEQTVETPSSSTERAEKTPPSVTVKTEETPPLTSESAEQTSVKKRSEETPSSSQENQPVNKINAKSFTYQDLEAVTQKFHSENFVGEGSFSRVHKGDIKNPDQIVVVKQLKINGPLGDEEFLRELSVLSELRHPNLMELIGYCSDGDHRLLVYEYMTWRSLDRYLLNIATGWKPLTWSRRMNIALDVALGLQYLHEMMNPPILYRELKCSNILLGEEFKAKLSNVMLAKLCPLGDDLIASSKVLGTYDYCAPEYLQTGELSSEPECANTSELSTKSDVYSFGVLMLELITGRKAVDDTKSPEEQGLVVWARAMFMDKQGYKELVDPGLNGEYPENDLIQAVGIAIMCVKEDPKDRPMMEDVVQVLSSLTESPKKYDMSKSRRTIRSRPVEIGSQADD